MENDETTEENSDYDFVDIGGAKQSSSQENRSWKFCNSISLPSAEVVFFTKICFIFVLLCSLYLIRSCLFTILVVTRLPFGFQYYPVQLLHVSQS